MNVLKNAIGLLAAVLIMSGCTQEQDLDLVLPEYESKLVVEGYLEVGHPFRVSVHESVSYFDTPEPQTVDDALVVISYGSQRDTLPWVKPLSLAFGEFYNYASASTVPADYDLIFQLYVKDPQGREVTGQTRLIPPVALDTLEWSYNAENHASVIAQFHDKGETQNYYRLTAGRNHARSNFTLTDILVADGPFDGRLLTLSSGYKFMQGDRAVVTLYHISEDYYRFLQTIEAAHQASESPLGQPASVHTNLKGGLGIFTALSSDVRQVVIQ